MKQTSFAAPAVRPIASAIFHQLAPPATSTAMLAKTTAIDLFDGGIVDRAEAQALGGFTSEREWNGTARRHRLERKRRAS